MAHCRFAISDWRLKKRLPSPFPFFLGLKPGGTAIPQAEAYGKPAP